MESNLTSIITPQNSQRPLYIKVPHRAVTEKYGFFLWGEDENEQICTEKSAVIFIPFSHFELVIEDFKSVFPIENYIFKDDNFFDVVGINVFD